jgi:hypothetical protein
MVRSGQESYLKFVHPQQQGHFAGGEDMRAADTLTPSLNELKTRNITSKNFMGLRR